MRAWPETPSCAVTTGTISAPSFHPVQRCSSSAVVRASCWRHFLPLEEWASMSIRMPLPRAVPVACRSAPRRQRRGRVHPGGGEGAVRLHPPRRHPRGVGRLRGDARPPPSPVPPGNPPGHHPPLPALGTGTEARRAAAPEGASARPELVHQRRRRDPVPACRLRGRFGRLPAALSASTVWGRVLDQPSLRTPAPRPLCWAYAAMWSPFPSPAAYGEGAVADRYHPLPQRTRQC